MLLTLSTFFHDFCCFTMSRVRDDFEMSSNRTNSTDFKAGDEEDILKVVRIVCEVWISLPVAAVGILGNTTSLVVLLRYKQSPVTTSLLKSISVTDTLILATSLVLRSMRYLNLPSYDVFLSTWFPWMNPVAYFLRVFNVWLTVLLTYERCVAVCYPLHVQFVCTLRKTRLIICIMIAIVSLISLPRFFEYRKVPFEIARTGFEKADLMTNVYYTVGYRIIFFFVAVYLVPLSALIFMNVRIVRTLRKSSRQRFSVFRFHGPRRRIEISSSSFVLGDYFSEAARSVTIIAVVIVTVSIACNLAVMVSHLLYAVELCFASDNKPLIYYRRLASNFSNTIVTFDSTINFIIYCVFSRKFRLTLKDMCCCQKKAQRRSITEIPGEKFKDVKFARKSTNSYT